MSSLTIRPAAAYVRMSTEHQRYSIANQLAAIEAYCESNDFSLVRIYTDAGKSGLTIAGRAGLQSLIADAKAGALPFEAVIVLDVSRWGRFQNVDEAGWLEHTMKRAGAPVSYCGEAFENDGSPGAAMIKAIKRAMAAEFSRELSRKVAAGTKRVAAQGWRPGSVAGYGYRRVIVGETGEILQVAQAGERKALFQGRTTLQLGPPEEVAAVQRIFQLYVRRHLSYRQIAEMLLAEGWPAPSPRSFCKGWVRCILGNQKYAGTLIWCRMLSSLDLPVARNDPKDWVVVEGAHPAIVSMNLFKAAQKERARRYISLTRGELISGLQRLHARYGVVSSSLIDRSRALPSSDTYQKAFGTLADAYRAAGLADQPLGVRRAVVRALNRTCPSRGNGSLP